MADWNPKANDLFIRAAEIHSAEKRNAFLAEQCGDDTELRRQVDSLLSASEQAKNFMDHPAAPGRAAVDATAAYRPVSEAPGTGIGPYKLLQQIGEGGFGTVFMAEQEKPVRRMVALKIIKPGMDTAQVIARFESERQALAIMDHPNIAKVMDAGATETGRPYFVMELVKGVPITEFCDKNHMAAEQRLKLFIGVCHAIQHAHHKGIIHRDIKPSNVMVTLHDGVPVVKVIDFGVAKATAQKLTERTMFTAYGQMIGTPVYMSPEQAEMSGLDIDTRSDIYSLGVLLYELLTGTTPLDLKRLREAGYVEMQRMIQEEDAPRPSTRLSSLGDSATILAGNRGTDVKHLVRLLRGDLDWIVMKALEKDRNRRYGTPGILAEDIERYLRHDAIAARPPSAGYRLSKLIRRNRVVVTAGSAVFAALLFGVVGFAWQAKVAREQRDMAVQARRNETEQRQRAEENERKAILSAQAERAAKETAEAREAEAKAVLDFVENKIFAAARPEGMGGGLGHNVTLRKAIESSLPFVEESFSDQPLIEARLRSTLGSSFLYLGEAETARQQHERALALRQAQLNPDDPGTLASMHDLARSYQELQRYAEAIELCEETLVIRKAKLGPQHIDTLKSMNSLANNYQFHGKLAEAIKLHEETLAIRKTRFGPEHIDTFASIVNLAISYRAAGRISEAVKLLEEALPRMETTVPDHEFTTNCKRALAVNYQDLGRHADAYRLFQEVLAPQKAKLGPDHPTTLRDIMNVAGACMNLGRHEEAVKIYEEALPLQKAKLGPDHSETLSNMVALGFGYQSLGRHAEALKLGEETLVRTKAKFGSDHPKTTNSTRLVAESYYELGRNADALPLLEEILARRKTQLGSDHRDTMITMNNLATTYCLLGRHAECIQLFEETLALRRSKLGPDHTDTLASMNNLAASFFNLGRYAEALPLYEEALALRKSSLGPDHSDTLVSMDHLADTYDALGRDADALKLREETLVLLTTKLGPHHPNTLRSMQNLAAGYFKLGRHAEDLKLREEMFERRKAALGEDHPDTLNSMRTLAHTYGAAGFSSDALKLLDELLRQRHAKLGPNHPETADSMNEVAWVLVTAADVHLHNPQRALQLAVQASAAAPENPDYLGTLGTARYRAGDWKGAVADLEKAIGLRKPDLLINANEGFFLAMTHWQLGEHDKSREWFDKAVAWMDSDARSKENAELKRFRAEAAELLGISNQK